MRIYIIDYIVIDQSIMSNRSIKFHKDLISRLVFEQSRQQKDLQTDIQVKP